MLTLPSKLRKFALNRNMKYVFGFVNAHCCNTSNNLFINSTDLYKKGSKNFYRDIALPSPWNIDIIPIISNQNQSINLEGIQQQFDFIKKNIKYFINMDINSNLNTNDFDLLKKNYQQIQELMCICQDYAITTQCHTKSSIIANTSVSTIKHQEYLQYMLEMGMLVNEINRNIDVLQLYTHDLLLSNSHTDGHSSSIGELFLWSCYAFGTDMNTSLAVHKNASDVAWNWTASVNMLQQMHNELKIINNDENCLEIDWSILKNSYEYTLGCCALHGKWRSSMALLEQMFVDHYHAIDPAAIVVTSNGDVGNNELYEDACIESKALTESALTSTIYALSQNPSKATTELMFKLLKTMFRENIPRNPFVYTSLFEAIAREKFPIYTFEELWNRLIYTDVDVWNSIIHPKTANGVLDEEQGNSTSGSITSTSYSSVELPLVNEMYSTIIGSRVDIYCQNGFYDEAESMLKRYQDIVSKRVADAESEKEGNASTLLHSNSSPALEEDPSFSINIDAICDPVILATAYTAMLKAYVQSKQLDKADALLIYMKTCGYRLSDRFINSIIRGLVQDDYPLETAQFILSIAYSHHYADKKDGLDSELTNIRQSINIDQSSYVSTYSALLNMGEVEKAIQLLDCMLLPTRHGHARPKEHSDGDGNGTSGYPWFSNLIATISHSPLGVESSSNLEQGEAEYIQQVSDRIMLMVDKYGSLFTHQDVICVLKCLVNVHSEPHTMDLADPMTSSDLDYNVRLAIDYHKKLLDSYVTADYRSTSNDGISCADFMPDSETSFTATLPILSYKPQLTFYFLLELALNDAWDVVFSVLNDFIASNYHKEDLGAGNSIPTGARHKCSLTNTMEKLIETSAFTAKGNSNITAKLFHFQLQNMLNLESGHSSYSGNLLYPSYKSLLYVCRSFDNECDWDGILSFFKSVGATRVSILGHETTSEHTQPYMDCHALGVHWEKLSRRRETNQMIDCDDTSSTQSNPHDMCHHYNPAEIEAMYAYMIDTAGHLNDTRIVINLLSEYLEYFFHKSNAKAIKKSIKTQEKRTYPNTHMHVETHGKYKPSRYSNKPVFTNGKAVIEATIKVLKKHDETFPMASRVQSLYEKYGLKV